MNQFNQEHQASCTQDGAAMFFYAIPEVSPFFKKLYLDQEVSGHNVRAAGSWKHDEEK